jgi:hypothetical protein
MWHRIALGRWALSWPIMPPPTRCVAGANTFSFDSLVLPKAGSYVVILSGFISGAGGGAIANQSLLTVGGGPKAADSFDASKAGVTLLYVRPTPVSKSQQRAVSLSSLVVPPPGAGAVGGGPANGTIYSASLAGPQGADCHVNEPQEFVWTISQVKPGGTREPVSDLVPLFGAPMHVAIVSADLSYASHAHGQPAGTSNSDGIASASGNAGTNASGSGSTGNTGNRRLLVPPVRAVITTTGGGAAASAAAAPAPTPAPAPALAPGPAPTRPPAAATVPVSFGPALSATVVFPKKGMYGLIAQVRRGDDFIWLPFYVDCSGGRR